MCTLSTYREAIKCVWLTIEMIKNKPSISIIQKDHYVEIQLWQQTFETGQLSSNTVDLTEWIYKECSMFIKSV